MAAMKKQEDAGAIISCSELDESLNQTGEPHISQESRRVKSKSYDVIPQHLTENGERRPGQQGTVTRRRKEPDMDSPEYREELEMDSPEYKEELEMDSPEYREVSLEINSMSPYDLMGTEQFNGLNSWNGSFVTLQKQQTTLSRSVGKEY